MFDCDFLFVYFFRYILQHSLFVVGPRGGHNYQMQQHAQTEVHPACHEFIEPTQKVHASIVCAARLARSYYKYIELKLVGWAPIQLQPYHVCLR